MEKQRAQVKNVKKGEETKRERVNTQTDTEKGVKEGEGASGEK